MSESTPVYQETLSEDINRLKTSQSAYPYLIGRVLVRRIGGRWEQKLPTGQWSAINGLNDLIIEEGE